MIDFVNQHADALGDLNLERVRQLCFVHEWPESICGDTNIAALAPELRAAAIISKHDLEMKAVESICGLIGGSVGEFALAAYVEFEGNATPEARFTKQLDKFHAMQQAWEYERAGQTVRAMEFIDYSRKTITHPALVAELARIEAEIAARSNG
jgi:putative hydrolase of HD superfamily